jgi:phosphatidylserine/phosphatidylglycerophosphate/cardiolipin synthase-like enzyme
VARFLQSSELWTEIRRRARSSRKLTAMVSYLGQHPDRLIRWPREAIVVADLSEHAVRRGASSARGALRLLRLGVRVFHRVALHAKVLLFERSAIVGSSNLSQPSADVLEEAGVLLTSRRSGCGAMPSSTLIPTGCEFDSPRHST